MRKINSPFEFIDNKFSLFGKNIIDVGCGTGDLVRAFEEKGASAVGIDSPEMLLKGGINTESENEDFFCGSAELLPFSDEYADIICYIASFHHIPLNNMHNALEECKRVLRISGSAIFIEPVPQPGSYYDMLKLVEDEKEVLAASYKMIKKLRCMNFIPNVEEFFYMERSLSDYEKLLNVFVENDEERTEIFSKAKDITEKYCENFNQKFEDFRYKSICRANIFVKS